MATDIHADTAVELRVPTPQDAAELWYCVRDSGSLDLNSPYAYLLVCSDFADTSLVARDTEGLLGFVAAYRPPRDPDAIFVWQVAVAERARGRGLGQRLLMSLLANNPTARELTATVTPGNDASLALFRGVARRLGAGCREQERFPAALFPDDGDGEPHLPEVELRIGPLPVR